MPALPSLEGLTAHAPAVDGSMLDMMGNAGADAKYGDQAMSVWHGSMMDHGNMNHGDDGQYERQRADESWRYGNMNHGGMGQMNHGADGFDFHNANRINGKAFDMNLPMFAAAKGNMSVG